MKPQLVVYMNLAGYFWVEVYETFAQAWQAQVEAPEKGLTPVAHQPIPEDVYRFHRAAEG